MTRKAKLRQPSLLLAVIAVLVVLLLLLRLFVFVHGHRRHKYHETAAAFRIAAPSTLEVQS
jgi:hypothetical protein